MNKSNRFKVIRRTGILNRDIFEYLVMQPTIDKKEEHYRKLQTKELGVDVIYPQLVGINFEQDIPKVKVPVYFLIGRKDYTTVQDIAYRYYEKLEAPVKKFYWFENEGHNNCYEDNKKFMDILTKEILPETQ